MKMASETVSNNNKNIPTMTTDQLAFNKNKQGTKNRDIRAGDNVH